ncbi:50S ribosomal protein L22 [endosymbiont of Sipalinus gigas]|uniref:50S ribosomal protein L22 n=1 Tax=endosymbiont of Sipalinus gigas TaxID=1972134 RepID=UPI000DC6E07E|nr:50S ribosomal protein L22 [endosymbiont of Sipalinus gigas]BBA85260.1 50S ribosomal protein L22 [endosymbiont of Sipalinus gigas]
MIVYSKYKKARISAQKVRLVSKLIKGKKVYEALNILKFLNKKASYILIKTLESAISNAENNNGLDIDLLKVNTVLVDEGSSFKRIIPRAKGRFNYIKKRTSIISIFLKKI